MAVCCKPLKYVKELAQAYRQRIIGFFDFSNWFSCQSFDGLVPFFIAKPW